MERKVVLYIAVSLDGYIARSNGEIDWLGGDDSEPNSDNGYMTFFDTVDTVIMGYTTYEQIMGWGDYPYKGKSGYVYTNKSLSNNEDVSFTHANPQDLIKQIRKESGRDIWLIGGAKLIDTFIKEDLIDEYIIATMPVLIGEGIALFNPNNMKDMKLKLKESKIMDGIVQNHYVKR